MQPTSALSLGRACRYRERLLISKRVAVEAAPGAKVVVEWRSGKPYECAVGSAGPCGGVLRGLAVRHSSPSVANNYAVFLQATLRAGRTPLFWDIVKNP